MAQQESDFKKKLRQTFRLEAEEHLRNLSAGLIDLEKTADATVRAGLTETIFRESHSLKGSARVVAMTGMETICHSLESVFAAVKKSELALSAVTFDGLHTSIDNAGKLLAALERPETPQEKELVAKTVDYLESLLRGAPLPLPQLPETKSGSSETISPAPGPGEAGTVRIVTPRLEALLLQAEELLSARQAAAQLVRNLEEITASMQTWRKAWQRASGDVSRLSSPQSRRDQLNAAGEDAGVGRLLDFLDWNQRYFKTTEEKISALSRAAAGDAHALSGRVNELTEGIKKVLMSPFSSMVEIFPRFVRDMAREQQKEIELIVEGAQIEIDRRILQEMKDPLTHLIRNAIDHGIETPQARNQVGKPACGRINLSIAQKGSRHIEIAVADDGRGIDLPAICQACVRRGLISQGEADKLSPPERMSLIWAGVSTRAVPTALSGRGLGLAITRERVEKLRGAISVETRPDSGTNFRIVLPLTVADYRGLVVRANEQLFVLPTVNVKRAIRVKREDIQTLAGHATIVLEGQVIALVKLADVLGISAADRERGQEARTYLPILVLRTGRTRLAFLVDEIVGEEEVLVKGLGQQLLRVRNIAGVSLLANGKVAPVLNIADLMKSAIKVSAAALKAPPPPEPPRPQAVLVVEDSITARTLLKNILEAVGYRARTAVDGLDALTVLKSGHFDLVVSDVDMPRMNGFDLTASIRADKELAATPVVLVTALESREDRERGIDVGASAYIVKSSFDRGNLIDVIKQLI